MTGEWGDRTRLAGAVALSVLASGAGVALLAASAWLLSRAAEHPPVMYLMVAVVGVRAFGLARGVFRYLERLVGHDVALRRQSRLRVSTYRALSRRRWLGGQDSDLLSRIVNDVPAVTDRVVRVVVPVVSGGVVLSAGSILMISISPTAGWVTTLAVLLGAVVMPWWSARLSAASSRSLAPLRGELAAAVAEAAEAAPDVIAYGAASRLATRVSRLDAALRRAEGRLAFTAGLAAAGQLGATALAVVAGLVLASRAVASGTLAPVELAMVTLTPLALHEVAAALPGAAQTAVRCRSALARVSELLRGPASPVAVAGRGHCGPAKAAITLTRVDLGWPGAALVVDGLDLSVERGERVALVGPSGVGKTTVAAAVLGVITPRSGEVHVSGSVGYLAQDAHLFDTTVAENLRIGRRDASDDELVQVLRRVGLDLGLSRLVGAHGSRISGGEARRVALARLLLARYDVLVVDEPTEHLDRDTADALIDDLLAGVGSATLVVITHDPVFAARCDRVVELRPRTGPVVSAAAGRASRDPAVARTG